MNPYATQELVRAHLEDLRVEATQARLAAQTTERRTANPHQARLAVVRAALGRFARTATPAAASQPACC